jgi:plastocyanin
MAGSFLVMIMCLAGCGVINTPVPKKSPTPARPTSTPTATPVPTHTPTATVEATNTQLVATPSSTAEPTATQPVIQSPGPTQVNIIDFDFSPKVITVTAGTTVEWTNIGPTQHTVADKTLKVFYSDILQKGQKFSYPFASPGTYDYLCTLHPEMKGQVVVR